jgi:parvulin-like peptidyl-prolyl isomerase
MAKKEKAPPKREATKRRLARWQRERRRRRITVAVGTLVIVIVLAIIGYGFYATSFAQGREHVTTVGDRDFNSNDYVRTLRLFPPSQNSTNPAQLILENMENFELLWQGSVSFNISVTDDEATQEIRLLLEEDGEPLTDEEFEERYKEILSAIGLSDEEYREVVKTVLIQTEVSEYFLDQVPQSAEQVHVEEIWVATEEEATEVMGNLSAGEDFASIAAKLGGRDRGWLPRGIAIQEFDDFAFDPDIELGTITPFGTDEGWYIIRVLGREEDKAIDEAKRDRLASNAIASWLADEWESKVERSPKYDPENPGYMENLQDLYVWALKKIN